MIDKDTLLTNFITLFKATGLSQNLFATLTKSSQSQVSSMLNRKIGVSNKWITSIIKYFNVDISKDPLDLDNLVKYTSRRQKRIYRPVNTVAKNNLQQLFETSGLSFSQFCKGVGIRAQTLREVVLGEKHPTPYIIKTIKEKTGIDIDNIKLETRTLNNRTTVKRLFLELAEQTNLSMADFSRSLGLSESYTSKIKGSERIITQDVIDKVEEVYNINLLTSSEINLSIDKVHKTADAIREDFLKIYTKYIWRKKEFKDIIGKKNYHYISQIVNKSRPVPKSVIENIRNNLGISIDKFSEELIGDSTVIDSENHKYLFLLNNNSVPLLVYTENEAKIKTKEFLANNIDFTLFKEIIL